MAVSWVVGVSDCLTEMVSTNSMIFTMLSLEGPSTANEYLAPFWSVNSILTFGEACFAGILAIGRSSIIVDNFTNLTRGQNGLV